MHKRDLNKLQEQQWEVVTVQLGAHLLYTRLQHENWSFQRYPACVGGKSNVLMELATV
jgi:hypothetical protein